MTQSLSSLLQRDVTPEALSLLSQQYKTALQRIHIGEKMNAALQLLTSHSSLSALLTCLKSTPFLEWHGDREFATSMSSFHLVHPTISAHIHLQHQHCLSLLTSLVYDRIMNHADGSSLFLLVLHALYSEP